LPGEIYPIPESWAAHARLDTADLAAAKAVKLPPFAAKRMTAMLDKVK